MLPKWKRCVVWVWHDDVASELKKALRVLLPGDVVIDEILGKTSQKKRNATARLWKAVEGNDVETLEPRVLVASIGAASQAISLNTAGLAVFVELDWAPLQMQQAEKRTHRFGQIHPCCEEVYVVLRGTIDEPICDVLLSKAEECENILGPDGQVDQMKAIFGSLGAVSAESDSDFMQSVAARLLAERKTA
jgi:SNF2 family DNA or RNA helicase